MQDQITQLEERVASLEGLFESLTDYDSLPFDVANAFQARNPRILFGSATLDFASALAGATESKSIKVVGAQPGDVAVIGIPSNVGNGGELFLAYVSSSNTVNIEFTNVTSGTINPASGVFTVAVIRRS